MNGVNAGFLKHFRHNYRFGDFNAAFDIVGRIHSENYGHVISGSFTNRGYYLKRKTHAVYERAAVSIVALIGKRGHELVYEISMCAVDLDAVKAALLCSARTFAECFDHIVYLIVAHLARNVSHCRLLDGRRCNGLRIIGLKRPLTACMVDLSTHKSACCVDAVNKRFPRCYLIIVPERADMRIASGIFREHESPAAARLILMIKCNSLRRRTVGISEMG